MIQQSDLRGDLHTHSTYSDGGDGLALLAEAAARLGYDYLAVTDHALTTHVHSHNSRTLEAQRAEIERLNESLEGRLTILQGVELDIGPKGELPDLEGMVYDLDIVVASIHSHFDLDRSDMTARVQKALSHPFVKIFGHPTARRTGTRPPVDMDLDTVFASAAENGVALEINATPTRLDLREDHIGWARKYGCKFSIDTDSHTASSLGRISLGVQMAGNAGLEPSEVVNCLSLEQLRDLWRRR